MLGSARSQHTAMLGSEAVGGREASEPMASSSGATVMDRGRQRRSSVFDLVKSKVGTTEEAHQFRDFVQATTALYGAILFWVGAWSLIDDQVNEMGYELKQHLKDIGLGTLLLVLSDTFYQVGFVYGSMFPPMMSMLVAKQTEGGQNPTPWWLRALCFVVVQLRVIIGLFGSVFLWNGGYNCIYQVFPEDWIMERLGHESLLTARALKLISCIFVGVLLVMCSGTMLVASGVPHVLKENHIEPAWGTPLRVHIKAFLVSTISTIGQALTWFGMYELCMTWCPYQDPPPTPDEPQCQPQPSQNAWKPISLLFIGLSLFFATDAFVSAAFLDDSQQDLTQGTRERKGEQQRRTAMLYFRAFAALIGAMTHNTGLWVLLDEVFLADRFADCSYFGDAEVGEDASCATRNLCFTMVGYLVMLLSNSAAGNAGVDKSFDMTPTPVLHVAGDRTKVAVSTLIQDGKTSAKTEVIAKATDQLNESLMGSQAYGGAGSD